MVYKITDTVLSDKGIEEAMDLEWFHSSLHSEDLQPASLDMGLLQDVTFAPGETLKFENSYPSLIFELSYLSKSSAFRCGIFNKGNLAHKFIEYENVSDNTVCFRKYDQMNHVFFHPRYESMVDHLDHGTVVYDEDFIRYLQKKYDFITSLFQQGRLTKIQGGGI